MANQSLSEMRQNVDRTRSEVGELVNRMENRLEEYTDWSNVVERYPFRTLAVMFGLGVLASGVLSPVVGGTLRMTGKQLGVAIKATLTSLLVQSIQQRMGR